MKTDTEDADEDGDTTDKVPAFLDKGETKKKKKGGKIPPQLEPHVRKAQGKKDSDEDEEEKEDVSEGQMDMDRMGVPMVAGGDVEGMANAAIAAIIGDNGGGGGSDITADATRNSRGNRVTVTWSGASSANVDIYRNGSLWVTTANDGNYTGRVGRNRTWTFEVCESGSTTECSDSITI